jgi:hypothetical protein
MQETQVETKAETPASSTTAAKTIAPAPQATNGEWETGNIIATIALVVSILSLVWNFISGRATSASNKKTAARAEEAIRRAEDANKLSQQANLLFAGASETALVSATNAAWERVNQFGLEVAKIVRGRNVDSLPDEDKAFLKAIQNVHKSTIERCCNLYESACGQYLDGKLDRERFRRHFDAEIRSLCEDNSQLIRDTLKRGDPTGRYKAIWKVYDQWFNLEKDRK